jgi:5-methylcytosine-specific restriction endonuclease McrA
MSDYSTSGGMGGSTWAAIEARSIRRSHLAEARLKGTHTELEWQILKHLFGVCAACLDENRPITKDHIVPISQGGSDHIDNIQPLCQPCNTANLQRWKDCREYAVPGWRAEFDRRMALVSEPAPWQT